jgi:hypothetical protein
MFKGLTRTILIVSAMIVLLPAVMMLAIDGSEWLERFQLMTPVF